MSVNEVYKYLEQLIKEGKGDYNLTCEGGCVSIVVHDEFKEVEIG